MCALSQIRRLGDSELGRIQPLFERVFGLPIGLQLLRWKYADGRGESWTIQNSAGDVSLHCGLFFRNILLAGQPVRAAQLVDLIAGPKASGLSRTQSSFSRLMHCILDDLPRADNPDGVAFGFPSRRAMRLGEHLGVYRAVDRLLLLKFLPYRSGRCSPRAVELLSFGPAEAAVADDLWGRMAVDLRGYCVGIRDAAFFRQRYLQHPTRRYVLLRVESAWLRCPIALVAIRAEAEEYELLDIVGGWGDMPVILRAIQAWLAATPGKTLVYSLTSHFAKQLSPFAESCEETQFQIMANPQMPASVLAQLEGRWWLTGGDTDYR